jgi:membrane-associated protease RseP (regulator of RpoE activity)
MSSSKATKSIATALFAAISINAVAEIKSNYTPSFKLELQAKKDITLVEVFTAQEVPTRPSSPIGELTLESDGSQSSEDLNEEARKQAAAFGADYVRATHIKQRAKAKTSTAAGGFLFAFGASSESEVKTIPKITYEIGVYSKSTLGVIWNQAALNQGKMLVSGFRSFSLAEKNGLKIDDEILEVNGHLAMDRSSRLIFLESDPGATVQIFVKRGDKTETLTIPLVATR